MMMMMCLLHVTLLDDMPDILANIMRLKSRLTNIVESDFGLLDQLHSLGVLTLPQLADVRSERTAYRRNSALLELLTSVDQCDKFLEALKRTDQQHVVNFIVQNGGKKTTTRYVLLKKM